MVSSEMLSFHFFVRFSGCLFRLPEQLVFGLRPQFPFFVSAYWFFLGALLLVGEAVGEFPR